MGKVRERFQSFSAESARVSLPHSGFCLNLSRPLFELHGAELAQGGMSAGQIINSLQIRKDLHASFLPGVIQATAEGEQLAQPSPCFSAIVALGCCMHP